MAVEEIDHLDYSLEGSEVEKAGLALLARGAFHLASIKVVEKGKNQTITNNGLANGEVSDET